jgi:hypothetical protein
MINAIPLHFSEQEERNGLPQSKKTGQRASERGIKAAAEREEIGAFLSSLLRGGMGRG